MGLHGMLSMLISIYFHRIFSKKRLRKRSHTLQFVPMATALKDHKALLAWEIINEAEVKGSPDKFIAEFENGRILSDFGRSGEP